MNEIITLSKEEYSDIIKKLDKAGILKSEEISKKYRDEKIQKKLQEWDEYFYNVCKVIASNSKCLSRQFGAILVSDKTIVGSGYNGPPRGIPRCDERWNSDSFLMKIFIETGCVNYYNNYKKCPRQVLGAKSGEMLNLCLAGHAERNALINSSRMGIKTKGCKLYVNSPIPCKDCLIEIINSGIEEVIVSSMDMYDEQSEYLLKYSDVKIRVFSHLKKDDQKTY